MFVYILFIYSQVSEMESNLPEGCKVKFDNPDVLHSFQLTICPSDGFWNGGTFLFSIGVPEEYNIAVSMLLKLLHL